MFWLKNKRNAFHLHAFTSKTYAKTQTSPFMRYVKGISGNANYVNVC